MTPFRISSFVLALSLALAPLSAQAQTNDDVTRPSRRVRDALSGDARAAFERGSVLYEDGDFRGARAEFERAFDLAGEPRVLYNVAVCDKMLRRYPEAIDDLERSLRLGGAKLPRDYVVRTRETIAALTPYVSKVAITADQDGASVLVDGEPAGTTPLPGPLSLAVGDHLVSVRKSGFVDVPKRVRVTGGELATASFVLEVAVSRSELSVNVSGAPSGTRVMVLLDGVEVGPAPFQGMVEAGPHTVGARAAGLVASPQRFSVDDRSPRAITLALENEVKVGRLRVRTDDPADVIALDGAGLGRGSLDRQIPAGEHRLRVERNGVAPRTIDFVIAENETRTIALSLEKSGGLPAWLWVGGGAVLAGGATLAIVLLTRKTEYQGSTPGTLEPGTLPASYRFGGAR